MQTMYRIDCTSHIEDEAKRIADILDQKTGNPVRLCKGQNYVGALGESYFRGYLVTNGIMSKWHSFVKQEGGNPIDFTILRPTTKDLIIDVKASGMSIEWSDIPSTKHLILVSQWEKIKSTVDYIVFVRNYESKKTKCGYIMGAITPREFERVMFDVKMQFDNYACLQSNLIDAKQFLKLLK